MQTLETNPPLTPFTLRAVDLLLYRLEGKEVPFSHHNALFPFIDGDGRDLKGHELHLRADF